MARVKLIEIEEAEGLVKEIYDDVQRVRGKGKVSSLLKGYAISPNILKANWERMSTIMGKGNLSKKLKESIALCLSIVNECSY